MHTHAHTHAHTRTHTCTHTCTHIHCAVGEKTAKIDPETQPPGTAQQPTPQPKSTPPPESAPPQSEPAQPEPAQPEPAHLTTLFEDSPQVSEPEHAEAPFQIGDRVESRFNELRYEGKSGIKYSMKYYLGVVKGVLKVDIGHRNRFTWKFIVEFDDGFEDEIEYTNKRTGVNNLRTSYAPVPDLPSPPSSPTPQSPVTSPVSPPPPTNPVSEQPPPKQPVVENPRPGQHETWVPIQLAQILFLDEKHVKCKLGHVSGYEWLMVVDPTDPNKIRSLRDGGVREKPRPYTKPKYPKEARALFGVSLGKDGEGRRMPIFNYTSKKVQTF